jgi:hypothetical protein
MVDGMKTPQPRFVPQVFAYRDEDNARRFALVFRKGRTLYHAVVATSDAIKLETFPALRGFTTAQYRGEDYAARRAASRWLNHDHRPIAKRARAVLKGLVARHPRGLTAGADAPTVAP